MPSLLGDILVKLGLDNSGLQRGLKESKSEIQGFGKDLKNIGGLIAGAFAAKEVVQFGAAVTDLAEKFQNVNRAFLRTGADLDTLRAATGGAVSDFVLLQNTVKAANFGIPVERLASAFKFATIRAAETGESVQFLVDSIVTGIGRKSALVLDNLGISLTDIQAEVAKTGDFAQAAFNLIERESAKSTTSVEQAATSTEKLTASWENLKLQLGLLVQNEGRDTIGLLGTLTQEAANLIDTLRKGNLPGLDLGGSLVAPVDNGALDKLLEDTRKLREETDKSSQAVKAQRTEYETLSNTSVAELEQRLARVNELILSAPYDSSFYKELQEEAKEIQGFIDAITGSLEKQAEVIKRDLIPAISSIGEKYEEEAAAAKRALELVQIAQGKAFSDLGKGGFDALGGRLEQDFGPTTGKKKEVLPASQIEDESKSITLNLLALQGLFENVGQAGFSFGDNVLNTLSGFAASFGRQLIALGTAKIALDKLFAFPGGGAIAVAAGVALIAAAGALKKSAASSVAAIGSGGGFNPVRGTNIGGRGFDREQPVFKVYVGPHELMSAFAYSSKVVNRTGGRIIG